jgi:hypothetical protein
MQGHIEANRAEMPIAGGEGVERLPPTRSRRRCSLRRTSWSVSARHADQAGHCGAAVVGRVAPPCSGDARGALLPVRSISRRGALTVPDAARRLAQVAAVSLNGRNAPRRHFVQPVRLSAVLGPPRDFASTAVTSQARRHCCRPKAIFAVAIPESTDDGQRMDAAV